jgi:integrase
MKGRRTRISLGLRVRADQWAGGRVIKHPNAALYNQKIAKVLLETEARLLITPAPDIASAKEVIQSDGGNGSFLDYAEKVLPVLRNEKTGKPIEYNTKRRWRIDLLHIRNYAPDLRWREITPDWLRKFNKHLLALRYEPTPGETQGKLRMEQNSARKTFVFIRRMFNEGIRDGVVTFYPFKRNPEERDKFTIPAETEKPTDYLTLEESDRIKALLDREDLSARMRTTIAHFLLECYSGIRHSDWDKWQSERLIEGSYFHLVTTKNKQPIYLPLKDSPRLKWVVDYIQENKLSYKGTNQDANRILKIVALLAGVNKNVTTHTGRRTAGTLLMEKGFSRETVAEVLGVTMKVIDRYARMTRQKVRGEYERIGGL